MWGAHSAGRKSVLGPSKPVTAPLEAGAPPYREVIRSQSQRPPRKTALNCRDALTSVALRSSGCRAGGDFSRCRITTHRALATQHPAPCPALLAPSFARLARTFPGVKRPIRLTHPVTTSVRTCPCRPTPSHLPASAICYFCLFAGNMYRSQELQPEAGRGQGQAVSHRLGGEAGCSKGNQPSSSFEAGAALSQPGPDLSAGGCHMKTQLCALCSRWS